MQGFTCVFCLPRPSANLARLSLRGPRRAAAVATRKTRVPVDSMKLLRIVRKPVSSRLASPGFRSDLQGRTRYLRFSCCRGRQKNQFGGAAEQSPHRLLPARTTDCLLRINNAQAWAHPEAQGALRHYRQGPVGIFRKRPARPITVQHNTLALNRSVPGAAFFTRPVNFWQDGGRRKSPFPACFFFLSVPERKGGNSACGTPRARRTRRKKLISAGFLATTRCASERPSGRCRHYVRGRRRGCHIFQNDMT